MQPVPDPLLSLPVQDFFATDRIDFSVMRRQLIRYKALTGVRISGRQTQIIQRHKGKCRYKHKVILLRLYMFLDMLKHLMPC